MTTSTQKISVGASGEFDIPMSKEKQRPTTTTSGPPPPTLVCGFFRYLILISVMYQPGAHMYLVTQGHTHKQHQLTKCPNTHPNSPLLLSSQSAAACQMSAWCLKKCRTSNAATTRSRARRFATGGQAAAVSRRKVGETCSSMTSSSPPTGS